ncbi:3-hydroxyacyl-ACP dehydratase FabZ family protein [Crossiella equi]|uniref:3-hydroxyacyl-ACP dehydratase FabZ family protein n=1 Tax=Crossiella equi TaxID=130796 RepID=UPI00130277E5|nr:3-hydroxyacyl-ACP dehydratase FabZ family protein [Crossiella equi]
MVSATEKDGGGGTAVATMRVAEDEPVFAGHYPNFPIFPGVCLIDAADQSARAVSAERNQVLRAVEKARFLGAVLPGDDLEITLDWTRQDNTWRYSAAVRSPRGEAAKIQLRYTEEPGQ